MGIKGLKTFITSHPELLVKYQLCNTKLVIDGNNLYYFLYSKSGIPYQYGGDYDQITRCCETFFANLQWCSITPFVIFDGAADVDGRKLRILLDRARQNVRRSHNVASSTTNLGADCRLLPILAYSTLFHLLRRLGIRYVVYDFEADRHTAALARHWNCPVLSDDSDFFAFDIPAGVVLTDSLDLKALMSIVPSRRRRRRKYLPVKLFKCTLLMEHFRIQSHPYIGLFATLLGNDIIDGKKFNTFSRRHIWQPSRHSTQGQRNIEDLLAWLQNQNPVSDAVATVLSTLSPSDGVLVNLSIETYTKSLSDSELALYRYFEENEDYRGQRPVSFDGNEVPNWFAKAISSGAVSSMLINVLTDIPIILRSQIESQSVPSSYSCSRKLRQYAYGILSSIKNPALSLQEYDRVGGSVEPVDVEPLSQTTDGRAVPTLAEIENLTAQERLEILFDILGFTAEKAALLEQPEVKFLVAVVRYWVSYSTSLTTVGGSRVYVQAMLLCFLKLGALDVHLRSVPSSQVASVMNGLCVQGHDTSNSPGSGSRVAAQDVTSELSTAIRDLKYKLDDFTSARGDHAVEFHSDIVYAFAEFQTCFQAASYIASLLILPVPNPATVFNGTLLHDLVVELRDSGRASDYVNQLLGTQSASLSKHYRQLLNTVMSDLSKSENGCSNPGGDTELADYEDVSDLDFDSDHVKQVNGYCQHWSTADYDTDSIVSLVPGCRAKRKVKTKRMRRHTLSFTEDTNREDLAEYRRRGNKKSVDYVERFSALDFDDKLASLM